MYLYIEILKQRLDAINQLRIDRALSGKGPVFQRFYSLLPTLLHYHHPLIPGYLEGSVPYGVSSFTPNKNQQQQLQDLAGGKPLYLSSIVKGERPVTGIYSMGSSSSVGQNNISDLDIWICHQSWLDNEERFNLKHKCRLLQKWCISMGMAVSFFLIDENRFRNNEIGSLNEEDCGSTQQFLLLDEFYRTAVRIAGKRILWNMVPHEEEYHYDDYVMSLYSQGILIPNEWLDLGSIGKFLAEEYFGASLWQLYKSIDSPYKSVIKTLLLEAYSWEYPNTQSLAMDVKQRLHNGEIVCFGLDSYCMMLERVTKYLISVDDMSRLDLVRRCFYLKVCEKLSNRKKDKKNHFSWRRKILTQLVKEWGWDNNKLAMLDNHAQWKIEQVREVHHELLDTMMQSYHNLTCFSRRNNLTISASSQDINLLTRKLYAEFEKIPGKVTLVNPQISLDISEKKLTFIYISSTTVDHVGWYLYNQSFKNGLIINHQHLEYNSYLNTLVAWAWFNGLLTSKTKLYIKGNNICDLIRLQKLVNDIITNFPLHLPSPKPQDLYSLCEIRHLAIMINLEDDPTFILHNKLIHFNFCNFDVFNFGEKKICLIGSIDLLYRNSWNEVHTLHFSGEQAITEALKTILCKIHQEAAPPNTLDVFCYSKHFGNLIHSRVRHLVLECIELRLLSMHQELCRFKTLQVGGQIWSLFFERINVSIKKISNQNSISLILEDYPKLFKGN
ncbi:class I adenylate cyclase [Pantoea sp. Aalb]|uniref:class I adenylate cyclase n=1 Tax=Pantoea sp. Aalb TaxID=2576762 RepID=UPI0013287944|nr:class I adenylate cyclase [Pantoea sp. Aalb]MXP67647.1 class I adenylate cyclase [Pantoea sp. Aalb]